MTVIKATPVRLQGLSPFVGSFLPLEGAQFRDCFGPRCPRSVPDSGAAPDVGL